MPPRNTKSKISGKRAPSTATVRSSNAARRATNIPEYDERGVLGRRRDRDYDSASGGDSDDFDQEKPDLSIDREEAERMPPEESRKKVARATKDFEKAVAQQKKELDDFTSDLLSILAGVAEPPSKERPAAYKNGMRYLEQCQNLLELYDEHNANVMDKRVDKAPERWEKEVGLVSKTLENGVSYGIDLVGAMLQPSLEPRLPMLDESRAEATEKAAVEMFHGHGLSTDTWGRTARVLVDGWSDFLQTPSRS